jgi:uncharacterized SAM-binding protein YcdF (DUF218 family)
MLFTLLALAAWGLLRSRRRLVVAGVAGIFLIAWPPVAWLALRSLEAWYSKDAIPAADVGAIVVLSSGVLPAGPGRPAPVAARDTYERCAYAVWMYRTRSQVPVLASGGGTEEEPVPSAAIMRDILIGMGVPESLVWIEDRSKSTHENAIFSAKILRERGIRRIMLVTEAYHMARAEACFRKQGLQVVPAPCGFHTIDFHLADLIPDGRALLENEYTLHELFGMAWYKLRGRI